LFVLEHVKADFALVIGQFFVVGGMANTSEDLVQE